MGSSRMNPAALLAVGMWIAVLNAAVEEAMCRGILMNALDAALGGGILPIVLQAIGFGTFHLNSTEPGVSALLGLVLGWLRRVGRGMLPPDIVHVLVDIGVWTLGMLRRDPVECDPFQVGALMPLLRILETAAPCKNLVSSLCPEVDEPIPQRNGRRSG